MTIITASLITSDPDKVYAGAYGPVDGKFGIVIGTMDQAPSGWTRPRVLLTSAATFDTAVLAQAAADKRLVAAKLEAQQVAATHGVKP